MGKPGGCAKKLQDVARLIYSRGGEPDLEGVDPVVAEQIRNDYNARQEEIDVWPENHEAVAIFSQCATQWRFGMAGPTGLDYTAVDTVMRVNAVKDPADCLWRIQALEGQALTTINASR